jgi:tetratricopeptide (TPR) repeat protein
METGFVLTARYLASAFLVLMVGLPSGVPAYAQQAKHLAPAETSRAEPSEAAFEQRLREAYDLMRGGSFDTGYAQLRAALSDLAKTDLFAFTVLKYSEAGQIFHQSGLGEEAEAVFSEGEQVRAMQEDVKERPDFYLAYAEFKVAARDFARIVPLYTTAANLYAQYYGTESREVLNCNDRLAVALDGIGQLGTAANLFQGNYDLALKIFGEGDELTWRLANNLAGTLRAIGAPSKALEYDLMVLAKRTERYGRDHFNVLVSANNTAQDYLDLGDYAGAISSFELNRQIAAALRAQDPGWEVQAETLAALHALVVGR